MMGSIQLGATAGSHDHAAVSSHLRIQCTEVVTLTNILPRNVVPAVASNATLTGAGLHGVGQMSLCMRV